MALPANVSTGRVHHAMSGLDGRILKGLQVTFTLNSRDLIHDPTADVPQSLWPDEPVQAYYHPKTGRLMSTEDGEEVLGVRLPATDDTDLFVTPGDELQWRVEVTRNTRRGVDAPAPKVGYFQLQGGTTQWLTAASWASASQTPVTGSEAAKILDKLFGSTDHGNVQGNVRVTLDKKLHKMHAVGNTVVTIDPAPDGAVVELFISRVSSATVTITDVSNYLIPANGAVLVLTRVGGKWQRTFMPGQIPSGEYSADGMIGVIKKTNLPDLSDTYAAADQIPGIRISAYKRLTGETTDQARAQRWMDAVIAGNGMGVLDGGDLVLTNALTGTVPDNKRVMIRGHGVGVSKIICAPENTAGGIILDTGRNPAADNKRWPVRRSQVLFVDFAVFRRTGTDNTTGNKTGTALAHIAGIPPNTGASGGGASNPHQWSCVIQNVLIKGEDSSNDVFEYGINLSGSWMPSVQNTVVSGPWTNLPHPPGNPQGTAWPDSTPSYWGTAALVMHDSYSPQIKDSAFWNYKYAVLDEGYNGEGGLFSGCKLVGVRYGIWRTRKGTEPNLQILNCHINARDCGVWADGVKEMVVMGTLFFNVDTEGYAAGSPADIRLVNVDGANISLNTFSYTQCHPDRIHIWGHTNGSSVNSPKVRDINILGNRFNARGQSCVTMGDMVVGGQMLGNMPNRDLTFGPNGPLHPTAPTSYKNYLADFSNTMILLETRIPGTNELGIHVSINRGGAGGFVNRAVIKAGPPNSGPGGAGRALYVDNS